MIILVLFLPFFMHLSWVRGTKLFCSPFHRQKAVVISSAIGLMLLIILLILRESMVKEAAGRASGYWIVIYLLAAYIYFHFFNMSETSRRIKILVGACEKKGASNALAQGYSADSMIANRLQRLVAAGELRFTQGRYFLRRRVLLAAAKFIIALHRILF